MHHIKPHYHQDKQQHYHQPHQPHLLQPDQLPAEPMKDEVCTALELAIQQFILSDRTELKLPSSLTSSERRHVHKLAQDHNLASKSRTENGQRAAYVYKKSMYTSNPASSKDDIRLTICASVQMLAASLLSQPYMMMMAGGKARGNSKISNYSQQQQQQLVTPGRVASSVTGKLSQLIPQLPSAISVPEHIQLQRAALPICSYKNEILHALQQHAVLVLSGSPGTGKSSQLPQYLLEYAVLLKQKAAVVIAHPSRIDAVSVADQIAKQRDEPLGQTVGFQIRLESMHSPKMLLTFCTNGVLLRTLTGSNAHPHHQHDLLKSVSHIVLDELNYRDLYSDLLLAYFRQVHSSYPHLKLILISSDRCNGERLSTYFDNCPHVHVQKPAQRIQEVFLEQILFTTGYLADTLEQVKKTSAHQLAQKCQGLTSWLKHFSPIIKQEINLNPKIAMIIATTPKPYAANASPASSSFDSSLMSADACREADDLLKQIWFTGDDHHIQKLLALYQARHLTLDYAHSESGINLLLACIFHNKLACVEYLLKLGIDLSHRTLNGLDALEWAKQLGMTSAALLLEAYLTFEPWYNYHQLYHLQQQQQALAAADAGDSSYQHGESELLSLYRQASQTLAIDYQLLVELIWHIMLHDSRAHTKCHNGKSCSCNQHQSAAELSSSCAATKHNILVLMPSYIEIACLRERIQSDRRIRGMEDFYLFSVHPHMQSTERKKFAEAIEQQQPCLLPPAEHAAAQSHHAYRLIILSTQLTDSSLSCLRNVRWTINVPYNDSCITKQMMLFAEQQHQKITNYPAQLISSRILKQRCTYSNTENGICYHLLPKHALNAFTATSLSSPSMTSSNLESVCLPISLLVNVKAEAFLRQTLDPPSLSAVRHAIHNLQQLEALDADERLTDLGLHMLDLPISPALAKTVLYSVMLKCLDPVLTIVCALVYRHPFIYPPDHLGKLRIAKAKRELAGNSCSDHMVLLRAFQLWQKARNEKNERKFASKHGLDIATMELIVDLRAQILGQLRATGFIKTRGQSDIKDLNANSECWPTVKAAIAAGCTGQLIRYNREQRQFTYNGLPIRFHPSSILQHASAATHQLADTQTSTGQQLQLPSDCLIAHQIHWINGYPFAQCCTAISPLALSLFASSSTAPELQQHYNHNNNSSSSSSSCRSCASSDSEHEEHQLQLQASQECVYLRINEWARFQAKAEDAACVLQLRMKQRQLFFKRMSSPARIPQHADDATLKAIVHMLAEADKALQMSYPAGVGDRPLQISTDFGPVVFCSKQASPITINQQQQQHQHQSKRI